MDVDHIDTTVSSYERNDDIRMQNTKFFKKLKTLEYNGRTLEYTFFDSNSDAHCSYNSLQCTEPIRSLQYDCIKCITNAAENKYMQVY